MSEIINIKRPTLETKTSQKFIMFINQNKASGRFRTCADYIKAFNEQKEPDKQIKRSHAYWIFKKLEIKPNGTRSTGHEESGNA